MLLAATSLLLTINQLAAEEYGGMLETSSAWVTVSSVPVATHISQAIQLNWAEGVEEVALFTTDPFANSSTPEPVLKVNTEEYPDGQYQTTYSLEGIKLPGGWDLDNPEEPDLGDQCVAYWIGSYSNDSLEQVDCFKIRPTWMSDNSLSIGSLPLTSLLWPGTHNSGCYKGGESLKPTLARFVLTQDYDVWTQLVYGIRYIDLRVGIYPVKQGNGSERMDLERSFWVNHDLIKVRPLLPILREIKQFLSKAKGEIVVLDFHRFPVGFSGRHARHNRLVELLSEELRDVAVEFHHSWPTLDSLWQQDKQLIIAYGDNEVAKKHAWMWPPLRQQWGNQQSVEGLEEFLSSCLNNTELRDPRRGMWAAMAQLTPGPRDLIFNPGASLRTMAQTVNPHLTAWLRDAWWTQANIVTSDFFLGNNVIDLAVAANIEKGNSAARYDLV